MASHIIDIENCETGTYTQVRKQLNESLGGPEEWDYDKPLFTLEASDEEFEALQGALSDIEDIVFLPNHYLTTEVEEDEEEEEEEVEEEEEEEEEVAAAPEPTPEPAPPREVIDYSKYRC